MKTLVENLNNSIVLPAIVSGWRFASPRDGEKLKAVVENLDDVPDALQPFYDERDGKFYLRLDAVREHPDAVALKNALDRVKAEKTRLQTEITELKRRLEGLPDDFTSEEYERLKQLEASLDPNDPNRKSVQEAVERAKEAMTAQHTREVKKHTDKIAELEGTLTQRDDQIRKLIIDAALDGAMDKALIDAKHRKAVRAMIRSDVKVVEQDGNLVAIVETALDSETPIEKYVADWAQGDEGKIYVAQASGGGAGGGGGPGGNLPTKNPWAKESLNLTEQGRLLKSDPQKAKRLAAQAGVTITI